MYYKGAKGALIVFDLSSKATFVNAEKLYNEIKKSNRSFNKFNFSRK